MVDFFAAGKLAKKTYIENSSPAWSAYRFPWYLYITHIMTYMFLWHDIYIIYRDIKNFDLIPTPEFEKLLEAEKNQGVFLLHHTSYFNVHQHDECQPFWTHAFVWQTLFVVMEYPLRLTLSNPGERALNPYFHRENGGTLGMVPLIINPIYTLYSGYLLGIPPSKGLLGGLKQLGYHPTIPAFSLWY